jgi:hypothetical protein
MLIRSEHHEFALAVRAMRELQRTYIRIAKQRDPILSRDALDAAKAAERAVDDMLFRILKPSEEQ